MVLERLLEGVHGYESRLYGPWVSAIIKVMLFCRRPVRTGNVLIRAILIDKIVDKPSLLCPPDVTEVLVSLSCRLQIPFTRLLIVRFQDSIVKESFQSRYIHFKLCMSQPRNMYRPQASKGRWNETP